MPSYWLGIDLGTTYTAAATCWPAPGGLEIQVVPLSDRSHVMPSVLYLPGDGSVVVGADAQYQVQANPHRVVREFKSRIGDEIPLLVGGSPYYAHDLAAEFVSWLWQNVAEREGEPAEAVALTCPVSWEPEKTALLGRAVRDAGVPNVMVLSEPQATAISYASRERVETGATLAVYDLGGASFGATVVRKDSPTRFTVLGQPGWVAGLGGLSFDEVIFEYVCATAGVPVDDMDPDDHALAGEVARLRRECTEAKEALSAGTEVTIAVALGGVQQQVRLTRAEFEDMIRPDLDRTIEAMYRTLGSAQIGPGQLDAILLGGGSSRIPLVSQLVSAEFGRPLAIDADPKVAVAMGAARFPAPVGAPVVGVAETAAQFPLDAASPQRTEIGGMPVTGEQGPAGLIAPFRHPSRKAMLGAAALVVLVVGGAATALGTPMLSGLISHHGTSHGTTAAGGITPSASGSPAPAAQGSVKPASARAKTSASGSATSAANSNQVAAAAKTSSKATSAAAKPGKSTTPARPANSHPAAPPTKTSPAPTTPAPTTASPGPTTPSPTPTTPSTTASTTPPATGTGTAAMAAGV
jgi:actin-like ATPase involved in cell morphogenesis